MRWSDIARQTISHVHATLPEDISFTARKKAIRAAYPFGERAYWPYKAWCKAVRNYLRRFDPKAPPPPLVAEILRDRVEAGDITFPFSTKSEEEK
ncbi:MAG TPA: hypothetical protein VFF89_00520 [Sphingobium sp.]|nr:hypothetical protein [Sphingobium sp.]